MTSTVLEKIVGVDGYLPKRTAHCAESVAKDYMPNTYDPSLKEAPSEFLQRLFDSGNRHEAEIFELIEISYPCGRVAHLVEQLDENGQRTQEGKDQLERDTVKALTDPNIDVILGSRFGRVVEEELSALRPSWSSSGDVVRISQPDVVVVVERDDDGFPTKLLPVDVKDHKVLSGRTNPREYDVASLGDLTDTSVHKMPGSPKSDDFSQLAHYYRHFQSLGMAGEPRGAIIGRELMAVWMDLNERRFTIGDGDRTKVSALEYYDHWLDVAQQVVGNARRRDAGEKVAPLSVPQLSTHCAECPWRTVCDEELTAHPGGGHVTLLPGITPTRAKPHYSAGVSSIRALARLDYASAVALDSGNPDGISDPGVAVYQGTGVKDLAKSVLQARVFVTGKVARTPGVDVVNLMRADVEFDFDLENSDGPIKRDAAATGREPLVYLWGTRQVTRRRKRDGTETTTVRVKQFSDFTDTDDGEAEAFAGFWAYMMDSRKRAHDKNKTWRAYHYTAHEIGWMVKLAEKHAGFPGVPDVAEVRAFTDSEDVVDLYKVLSTQLMWPTRSHSIKDLAKWARFSWRAQDAGGDNSMMWFEMACIAPTAKERAAFRKKVLDYNVDDVAAQHHLREWISSLERAESPNQRIPAAESLRRPRV